MNNIHCILSSVILAAMTLGMPASAQEVGRVLFANGDVRIVAPNGSSRAAKRGDPVRAGERLQTGTGALGQVKMNDGGRVGVRAESKVRFDPPAPTGTSPTQLGLESGNVRVLNMATRGGQAPKPVEIKTPDGDVVMREADAVIANLGRSGGADATRRVVVRMNEGKGEMAVKGGAGEQKVALVRGKKFDLRGGAFTELAGRSPELDQPLGTASGLQPSDSTIKSRFERQNPDSRKGAPLIPGRPNVLPSGRPIVTTSLGPRSIPRSPLNPLRRELAKPVGPLVQPTQLETVLAKKPLVVGIPVSGTQSFTPIEVGKVAVKLDGSAPRLSSSLLEDSRTLLIDPKVSTSCTVIRGITSCLKTR